MRLERVTITGADDHTDISDLLELSVEFPFVEWGILVSRRQEGGFRFPSREWIERFSTKASGLHVSMHICGEWLRELFVGELNWDELPACLGIARRIQLNTHAEQHWSTAGLFDLLARPQVAGKQIIWQWDAVNDHLAYASLAYGLDTAVLHDTSHGAGLLRDRWPLQPERFAWCGYAGGLGPHNVAEQLRMIEAVTTRGYWIDMEGQVRTPNERLDIAKVRAVLKSAADACAEGK